jgi:hypothetical protein
VAVDPGTTSGILVASIKPAWIKGQGSPSWEGLGAAITFKAAYQVGRHPKAFDVEAGRALTIDREEGLDTRMLPVLAESQPLLDFDEFDGRGRRSEHFYSVLRGERPGGGLLSIDASEVLQVRQIAGLLDNFPEAAWIIEDFQLRMFNQDREVLSPARLRLALQTEEILHGASGRVPFLQQPSVITAVPDERLKRANLYFRGMPHATDAARHLAAFFRRCRSDESVRSAAYPRHFNDWED